MKFAAVSSHQGGKCGKGSIGCDFILYRFGLQGVWLDVFLELGFVVWTGSMIGRRDCMGVGAAREFLLPKEFYKGLPHLMCG